MENNKKTESTRARILSLIASEFESDAAFERELSLPPKTVNNWRRGRSASFMKMLPRLADSFDVNVGELLDIPIQRDTSELSSDEISLLSIYRKSSILTAKQRAALYKTLEEIINLYINSAPDRSKTKKKEF
jgi:hypothetical protein